MFELIASLIEALASFISGYFKEKHEKNGGDYSIIVSALCGLVFFVGFGIYEYFSGGDKIIPLIVISLFLSIIICLLMKIFYYFNSRA